ncbi:hypothetical protein ABGB07_25050 [Micromonosporaceae bacterium B7E4]
MNPTGYGPADLDRAGLALVGAGDTWGLGRTWPRLPVVRRQPWLK